MRLRRLVALAAVAGPALALWVRHRRGAAAERVTLGYADGSALTLAAGSPGAERLLALAHPLVEPRP